MRLRAAWLLVTATLFVGWIGWLFYLAVTSQQPITVSRAQLLVAPLDVIAAVEAGPDGRADSGVRVAEVRRPAQGREALVGRTITVKNLPDCTAESGWDGPGDYILALQPDGDQYRVAPIPRSPGYPPPSFPGAAGPAPRIYRLTPETSRQLDAIPGPTR
jgi:hypothetical protein